MQLSHPHFQLHIYHKLNEDFLVEVFYYHLETVNIMFKKKRVVRLIVRAAFLKKRTLTQTNRVSGAHQAHCCYPEETRASNTAHAFRGARAACLTGLSLQEGM